VLNGKILDKIYFSRSEINKKKTKEFKIVDLFRFFSDYLQSQLDEIPGYFYLFLAILIRIYKKMNKMI
jgi:hypothetical protein